MKKHNSLIENIFSMLTLRGLEYILSFLLVPYLLRVLGPANFGAVAFMQGVIVYFNLFIDYGFNLTAPRALARASQNEISILFSTFMWAKLILLVIISVIFCFILWMADSLQLIEIDWHLFGAVYITVIGNVFFPVWFFQGIQQMRYITIINLIGRTFSILCIFVFVSSADDYILAAFFQSFTPFAAGILSLALIAHKFSGIFCRPNLGKIKQAFKEARQIFISNLAISLYTSTDIVLLGLLTNNTIVGYYSGADKLLNCIKRGISAINDAIYPYISQMFKRDYPKAISFLKKQLLVYAIGGTVGGIVILAGAPVVIPWLLGNQYIHSIRPLQIMAFVPLIVSFSNIFGYETMLPLGMEKIYSRILLLASTLNIAIIIPFIMLYQENGVSAAILITELFVTVIMGIVLRKKDILLH